MGGLSSDLQYRREENMHAAYAGVGSEQPTLNDLLMQSNLDLDTLSAVLVEIYGVLLGPQSNEAESKANAGASPSSIDMARNISNRANNLLPLASAILRVLR